MARHNRHQHDDEKGDIYDKDPWWLDKLEKKGKAKTEETVTPKQCPFKLSSHHVLCYDGYQRRLIVKDDPGLWWLCYA
jgi:hypothetical protein